MSDEITQKEVAHLLKRVAELKSQLATQMRRSDEIDTAAKSAIEDNVTLRERVRALEAAISEHRDAPYSGAANDRKLWAALGGAGEGK